MLEKDAPSKTSEFGSCGYVSGLSFAWSLLAERFASELFQILGTSPAKAR